MSSPSAKVLIVEDDLAIRSLYAHTLTQRGFEVQLAEDGFSALAEIRSQMPDVILSDLNMPGMSGFEFLSVVRRRFPEVQVIAMSGAFSGEGVPPGVTADAFYEKGSAGMGPLLKILETMTQPDRLSSVPKPSAFAPVWIPTGRDGDAVGDHVIITCPECLRSFASLLGERRYPLEQIDCAYCACPIQYETGHDPDGHAGMRFGRKTGAGIPATPAVSRLG